MNKFKESKGITIVSVLTAIVILAILAGVSVYVATDYMDNLKLKRFNTELQIITDRVNVITKKIEVGNDSYLELGKAITSEQQSFLDSLGFSDTSSGFRLFEQSDLEQIDITGIEQSVFINFTTGQIVSKDGLTINEKTYYVLD